jgi:hypothetical protein
MTLTTKSRMSKGFPMTPIVNRPVVVLEIYFYKVDVKG